MEGNVNENGNGNQGVVVGELEDGGIDCSVSTGKEGFVCVVICVTGFLDVTIIVVVCAVGIGANPCVVIGKIVLENSNGSIELVPESDVGKLDNG
jgi:hypothetical protein